MNNFFTRLVEDISGYLPTGVGEDVGPLSGTRT